MGRTRLEGSRANADAGKGGEVTVRGEGVPVGLVECACVLRDAGTRGDRIGRQGPDCFTVQSRWMRLYPACGVQAHVPMDKAQHNCSTITGRVLRMDHGKGSGWLVERHGVYGSVTRAVVCGQQSRATLSNSPMAADWGTPEQGESWVLAWADNRWTIASGDRSGRAPGGAQGGKSTAGTGEVRR